MLIFSDRLVTRVSISLGSYHCYELPLGKSYAYH